MNMYKYYSKNLFNDVQTEGKGEINMASHILKIVFWSDISWGDKKLFF